MILSDLRIVLLALEIREDDPSFDYKKIKEQAIQIVKREIRLKTLDPRK